eukprot:930888-Prymnesium_polylepis.1
MQHSSDSAAIQQIQHRYSDPSRRASVPEIQCQRQVRMQRRYSAIQQIQCMAGALVPTGA